MLNQVSSELPEDLIEAFGFKIYFASVQLL